MLEFIRRYKRKLLINWYTYIAVADIFDALYSDRPYRNKMPLEKVKEILKGDSEKGYLDKKIVNALFELIDNENLGEID